MQMLTRKHTHTRMDEKGYIVTEEVWEEVEDETPPPVGDAGSAAAAPVNVEADPGAETDDLAR